MRGRPVEVDVLEDAVGLQLEAAVLELPVEAVPVGAPNGEVGVGDLFRG